MYSKVTTTMFQYLSTYFEWNCVGPREKEELWAQYKSLWWNKDKRILKIAIKTSKLKQCQKKKKKTELGCAVQIEMGAERSLWCLKDPKKSSFSSLRVQQRTRATGWVNSLDLANGRQITNLSEQSVSNSLTCSRQQQSLGPVWNGLRCSPLVANLCR